MRDQPQDFALTAIIINSNGGPYLQACVASVLSDPCVREVIVVDNASSDGSARAVRQVAGRTKVILSSENLGFGGGANWGAAYALTDLLVFLNPDVLPEGGCMEALARHLLIYGGVAGPTVRQMANDALEYGATIDRMLLPRGLDRPRKPLYVQGCCLATTRSCFQAVGGFDARYFLFAEDMEYCWQALRRGFSVQVVTEASVCHIGGTSATGGYSRAGRIETSSTRVLLRERNSWTALLACAPLRHLPSLLLLSAARTLAFTAVLLGHHRMADCLHLWGGLGWNLRNLPTTLARRRRPGVNRMASIASWHRVDRNFFLWDSFRRGHRLRFVDSPQGVPPR